MVTSIHANGHMTECFRKVYSVLLGPNIWIGIYVQTRNELRGQNDNFL